MTTLTPTGHIEARIRALAAARPGVSRHKIGIAMLRLAVRVDAQQPEAIDAELGTMDQEAAGRRSGAAK
jgi:hypothetical protein